MFKYIFVLLKHTPGSPVLTFEKLYVMFTKQSYITYNQKFWPQNGEWILTKLDIENHMYLILLHCQYPKCQKLLQHIKKENNVPIDYLIF
jgi:hypothetical protein